MTPKRGSGAWIRYGERLADGEIAFAAAHYRTAILQPWETEAAARLKDLRDDMVILAYRCLSSARDFEPAHRRASGLGFAEAQRRGWLARRASGRTLEWSTYPGHYQMRVWDEAYRRRWIERVLEATAGTPTARQPRTASSVIAHTAAVPTTGPPAELAADTHVRVSKTRLVKSTVTRTRLPGTVRGAKLRSISVLSETIVPTT